MDTTLAVTPVVTPNQFGYASLDSIGVTYALEDLESLLPNPESWADAYPEDSHAYIATYPDSASAAFAIIEYQNDPRVLDAYADDCEAIYYSPPPISILRISGLPKIPASSTAATR